MKSLFKKLALMFICFSCGTTATFADNQTPDVTPVLSGSGLPFNVVIQQANFQLPVGIHSGAFGVYQGLWVFVAGRMNGLHGFGPDPFPPDQQNTTIYVVNPTTGATNSRSLIDPSSGLNQQQIDELSVTSPEFYQDGNTLYMAGGYGIDTPSGTYGTKTTLTAFNLPGVIQWVMGNGSLIQNISQVSNPVFQITGGEMFKLGNVTELVFGQNFTGPYTSGSNGIYSDQVFQFQLTNAGGQLSVNVLNPMPLNPNANFRRRDLNVVPALLNNNNTLQYGLVAYAGVFTLTGGVWNVPVVINGINDPVMADPNAPTTFKQAMNQYVCANVSLYSRKYTNMYNIFFGGISYGFFSNGTFQTDSEIPFINQVTTIQMDRNGNFSQYLMNGEYPSIISPRTGAPLLFGASAYFIPNNISQYPNGVLNLDNIRQPTVIGYIVGGIQSTLANTNTMADSAASPYIFTVTLTPNGQATQSKKLT